MSTTRKLPLKSFEQIHEIAQSKGQRELVVAGAHSKEVIEAIIQSQALGLTFPHLVGDSEKIQQICSDRGIDITQWKIYDAKTDEAVATQAVSLIDQGVGCILMKGQISTPILLKKVLNPEYNLRTGNLLSHVALLNVPSYPKLLMISDSGMVTRPNLDEKVQILQNALNVFEILGVDQPKVAILAANEKVSDKLPETIDAVQLVEQARNGNFGNCIVEGPYALDIAFSPYAAKIKNIETQIHGDPDLLLMPDVTSGNILAKGLVYLANAQICGLVVGARIPIILISRAEYAESWVRSIAFASLICEK